MTYILSFAELGKDNAGSAGGKGASLGEMTNAGIPVPPGFVVLAGAFEYFLQETDLVQEIDAILNTVDTHAIHTVEKASADIQALVLHAPMPADISREILEGFRGLDTPYVAVRSSATAEDGAEHAWAGQLDSFLNTTKETLIQNVQKCWASLFTPRAIFYRFEKGLDSTHISVAVVVQAMINSEASGIAFSVHPVTEDRDQIIIEAGFGLGEAIVSGQVTPDSYVVSKSKNTCIDINVNDQGRALYRNEGGGNTWKDLGEKGREQVLTETQILELATLVKKIEDHYGFPCDIEWCFENGQFYIVQSRPITTLQKKSTNVDSFRPDEWELVITRNVPIWTQWLSGLGHFHHMRDFGVMYNLQFMSAMHNGTHGELYYPHEQISTFAKAVLEAVSTQEKIDILKQKYITFGDELLSSLETVTHSMNLQTWDAFVHAYTRYTAGLSITSYIGRAGGEELEKALRTLGISYEEVPHTIATITYPDTHTPLFLSQRDLMRIGARIQTEHLNEHAKETELNSWVHAYGAIPVNFCDEPWTIEDARLKLEEFLAKDCSLELKTLESEHAKRIQEKNDLLKKIGSEDVRIRAYAIAEGTTLNEYRKNIFCRVSLGFRDVFQRIAEIAGSKSWRNCLYLTPDEMRSILSGEKVSIPSLIDTREDFVFYVNQKGDTVILTPEQVATLKRQRDSKKHVVTSTADIRGFSAQRGCVRGTARIVLSSKDFHKVSHGDILVAPMTSVDFVPIMERAAAFVTNEGGITSHASIVSRELGKPCIIGTKIATQILKDGDMVEVDADNGVVRVINKKDVGEDVDLTAFNPKTTSIEHADGLPVYFEMTMAGFTDTLYDSSIASYNVGISHFKQGEVDYISLVDDQHVIGKNIVETYIKSPSQIRSLYTTWKTQYETIESYAIELLEKDLSALSTEELLTLSDNLYHFFRHDVSMPGFSDGFMFYAEKRLAELLRVFCNENNLHEYAHLFAVLTASIEPSFFNEKESALWNAHTHEKEKILKKYAWIRSSYAGYVPYTHADITKEKKELKDPRIATEQLLSNAREKEALIQTHVFTPEIIAIVRLTELFTKWQDQRKEYTLWYVTLRSKLVHAIALSIGYEAELLAYALTEELNDVISGSLSKDALQERRDTGVLFVHAKGTLQKVITGDEAEAFMKTLVPQQIAEVQLIHGTTASRGKVSGPVKIVTSVKHLEKVENGDVLVAPMTRPEHLPGMKKASAIITDDGGITCHAAIVSRELGKPCIIGTKIATQILKDGDMVEVDADNGVVRVISHENKGSIIPYIQSMRWERWLERPFYAFLASFFEDSGTKDSFQSIGIANTELSAQLFQNLVWYKNDDVLLRTGTQVANYLSQKSMTQIVRSLQEHEQRSTKTIQALLQDREKTTEEKVATVYEIMKICCTYIWLAHSTEAYYKKILDAEVPKYIKKDIEKFIGDASLPRQKNEHALFEDALRSTMTSAEIAKRFAWLKARDVFSEGFTVAEIDAMRKDIQKPHTRTEVAIPYELAELFNEVRALVYFRTARSDVWRKLMYLARPIFEEIAQKNNIPFKELQYYRSKSLIDGKLEKYNERFTFAHLNGESLFTNESIVPEEVVSKTTTIRGTTAYLGKMRSTVRIVKKPEDTALVQKGDILVTQMTFPSFMPAMMRASAFVTDEGGITCHAAIIAREMKKPCIIGTKIATQILKDGDFVEVDADNGVVRIIS